MASPPVEDAGLSTELRQKLESLGIPVLAWDPRDLEAVLKGHMTLGELAGISKDKQYEMARMGLKFLEDGLRDKGIEVFLGLEALDPYDAYVQAVLAQQALEDEDLEQAERRFSRALELNPFSVPALAGRGELRLRMGRRGDGIADLEAALRQDPLPGNEDMLARARVVLDVARKAPATPAAPR